MDDEKSYPTTKRTQATNLAEAYIKRLEASSSPNMRALAKKNRELIESRRILAYARRQDGTLCGSGIEDLDSLNDEHWTHFNSALDAANHIALMKEQERRMQRFQQVNDRWNETA